MKVEVLSEGGGVGENFFGRLCLGFEDLWTRRRRSWHYSAFFVWGF